MLKSVIMNTIVEIIANFLLFECILSEIPTKINDQTNARNSINENMYATFVLIKNGEGFENNQYFPNNANSIGRIITKNNRIGI
jgi:hypothetical protein